MSISKEVSEGQVVLVRAEGSSFAFPASRVVEYLDAGEVSSFPALRERVGGMARYRDSALPVVSLSEDSTRAMLGKWLVISSESRQVIVEISSVVGFSNVESTKMSEDCEVPSFVVDGERYVLVDSFSLV